MNSNPQKKLEIILDIDNERKHIAKAVDPFRFKAQRRSLLLSYYLIDDKGELKKDELFALIPIFAQASVLYSEDYHDYLLFKHQLGVLKRLNDDVSFYKKIKKFQKPLCNKGAENLIHETFESTGLINDAMIRRAVLSACLTILRQNIGSCFATAPAILIHEDQMDQFLNDLYELLTTGKLKRTFGGIEHTVPLSPSSGKASLRNDHPLLKAWEFTLASFSEIKMEFSKWNLYSSLGLDPNEEGGIGRVIFNFLNEKIEESNEKIQEAQAQYEIAFEQLRATEVLLRNASTESEIRRLKAEHQSRYYHMQACLDQRNEFYESSTHYTNFFNFLLRKYEEKFFEYFQEIYDAEMLDINQDIYDDSPAGFRLVYKYGRKETAAWALIRDEKEWIAALCDFFPSVEFSIMSDCETEKEKDDVVKITTEIVHHLRTKEFLLSALKRSAKSPRMVTQGKKNPWAYISGGSMETLLKTYYRREQNITSESKKVESELELLIFILDTLKGLPPKITDKYPGMLMQSPTHAFILHPQEELLKKGWSDRGFTYTWVRDEFILPREFFYKNMILSREEQQFLLDRFSERLPTLAAHQLQKMTIEISSKLNPMEFKSLLQGINIDSFLYEVLPLTTINQANKKLNNLLQKEVSFEFQGPFVTRKEIEDAAKLFLSSGDIQAIIANRSSEINLAPPPPLIFADTNWACFYFAFIISPATGALELWRMDRTGSIGSPMHEWKAWLNGSQTIPWTIYTHPYEYSS